MFGKKNKAAQTEREGYIKEIRDLNVEYTSLAAKLEALREENGSGSHEEREMLLRAIDLSSQLAERCEGAEQAHWLRQLEARKAEYEEAAEAVESLREKYAALLKSLETPQESSREKSRTIQKAIDLCTRLAAMSASAEKKRWNEQLEIWKEEEERWRDRLEERKEERPAAGRRPSEKPVREYKRPEGPSARRRPPEPPAEPFDDSGFDFRTPEERAAGLGSPLSGKAPAEAVVRCDGETEVTFKEDPYYHGEEGSSAVNEIGALSFRFGNNAADIYPGDPNPEIPLERFQQVFGNTALALGLWLNDDLRVFGGLCFGMAAASAFFSQKYPELLTGDFRPGASVPYDLDIRDRNSRIGMNLRAYIEALFIMQVCGGIQMESDLTGASDTVLDELWEKTLHFQQTGDDPVVLGVTWALGGHAVLPYKVEEIGDKGGLIYICDSNWKLSPTILFLQRGERGHFEDWTVDLSHGSDASWVASSENEDVIDFVSRDTLYRAWKERGKLTLQNGMISVGNNSAVTDEKGSMLFRVKNGSIESYRDNCVPINLKRPGKPKEQMVSLPVGNYRVVNEDAGQEELHVRLIDVNQFADVHTAARSVELHVTDALGLNSVSIPEGNMSYNIRLYSTLPDTWEDVVMQGVTEPEGLTLSQYQGVVYATSLENGTLTLNGEPAAEGDVAIGLPDWKRDTDEETEQDEDKNWILLKNKLKPKPEDEEP